MSHHPGKQITHLDALSCTPVNFVSVVVLIEVEVLLEIIVVLIQGRIRYSLLSQSSPAKLKALYNNRITMSIVKKC